MLQFLVALASSNNISLCSLCNRFLSKYPEYPKVNQFIEIGLDDVAKDLSKKNFLHLMT